MYCPEYDPKFQGDKSKFIDKIRNTLDKLSIDSESGCKIGKDIKEFIQDWQYMRGRQMTFRDLISSTDYHEFCFGNSQALIEAWNELSVLYGFSKTDDREVYRLLHPVTVSSLCSNPSNDTQNNNEQQHDDFKKPIAHTTKFSVNPIVVSAIIIAVALLIVAIILRQPTTRYKSIGNGMILDSESGDVHWARPQKK